MDDPRVKQAVLHQYRAALAMLAQAVERCPEELWLGAETKNRFWHIAYHAVFYTHLYVQPSEADFKPWPKHRQGSNYLGPQPWAKDKEFVVPDAYSKADVQEYLALCRHEVEKQVPLLKLEGDSGFSWLAFDKLELQFYNIRHLQHHIGQLADRLRNSANTGLPWVGSVASL